MGKAHQTIHRVTNTTIKTKTRTRKTSNSNNNRCPTCGKFKKK